MIAISIGKGRYSHDCLGHCPEFTLCFPSEDQRDGAWLCGKKSGRGTDKFQVAGFTPFPAKVVKPPLIEGSTVAYECQVATTIDVGDHTLYLGNVVAIHGTPTRPSHLYSIHYKKLLALDCTGHITLFKD